MLACEALLELGPAETQTAAKANIVQAIDRVAGQLNNTRAVCRRYYVHPDVLAAYAGGILEELIGTRNGKWGREGKGLGRLERRVVRLLRERAG